MPTEVALWRLGAKLTPIHYSSMETESILEQVLADNITIINPNLLLIGRQVPTAYGKFIGLVALDGERECRHLRTQAAQNAS